MLQITTGKLFTADETRQNQLVGVLYTNLDIGTEVVNISQIGKLVQTSELHTFPRTLLFKFVEKLEGSIRSGVVDSYGPEPYLNDMAVLISFFFNCTCSTDIELVKRLTSGQRGVATLLTPNSLIRNVFDKRVRVSEDDVCKGIAFIEHLLGVKRSVYLGAMSAIRTYVTGLHRISDDLELAYTLMVAAGESLTQSFDGYSTEWLSISGEKRKVFDTALEGADSLIQQKVRDAVLKYEHAALGRRFKLFVAEHVSQEYFRESIYAGQRPLARSELAEVLTAAYGVRSNYVHQLKSLPELITLGHGHHETIHVERQCMLTLQGLTRLMRHVILNFVQRQETIVREVYNYSRELTGVVYLPLAPEFWLHNADGNLSESGRKRLEGFLEQFERIVDKTLNATVTDISEVLLEFVESAHTWKSDKRRPYLALLLLFNLIAGEKAIKRTKQIESWLEQDLVRPTSEALICLSLYREIPTWTLDEHTLALRAYKSRRSNKNGLRFPRFFEAVVTLDLSERYRTDGEFERCKELICEAADDFPEHLGLRNFITEADMSKKIDWKTVLVQSNNSNLDEVIHQEEGRP